MSVRTEAVVSQTIADLENEDLLGTFSEGQRLVGTQCETCRKMMLGARTVCSSCVSRDVSRVALPATGTLYSFTRLHVGGDGVRPIGYVDLDNGVRTLADIREGDTTLRPDLHVELGVDGDSWFFAPVRSASNGVKP